MNLKIRLQSKTFWVGLVSALFVFLSQVLPVFGVTIELGGYEDAVMSVLSILTVLGVFTDPTTPGVGDSDVTLQKDDITQTAGEVLGMD